MNYLLALLIFIGLQPSLFAQQSTPSPKKDPFEGFGGTALDRRPGGKSDSNSLGGSSAGFPPRTQPPAAPMRAEGASAKSGGIVLSKDWAGHLTQGSGGQTMKMADLRFLLASYGNADADLGPHPEVTVYEGSAIGGAAGQNCRVTYLMPLASAEAALMKSRGIVTADRAVAPGFPDGLFIHTYDVQAGIYNRLCILTDSSPQQQVVSLLFKAETANWYPPSPPFRKIERNWHTHDYLNTENRGQPGMRIDTRVNDLRERGGYIVVNLTGGSFPPMIPPPGVVLKPARNGPKETATWYLPEPMIKLMLQCLAAQLGP